MALVKISEKLNGLDARIVHTQHDEIIVKAPDEIVDRVTEIVKSSMEEALSQIIPGVQFEVEIREDKAWR